MVNSVVTVSLPLASKEVCVLRLSSQPVNPSIDHSMISDVLLSDFENVLATFRFFLERNSKARCWVAYQERR